ncbi:hypothetical protein PR202_gb24698 [Eleusine coracana subsp. coracana]|uniref:NPH3 domain-containing protein n=1 Tax=Eleusine coracana subsp. coracana TaxID=191504 RepID=A0AAV5FLV3_ELECO|nr:hypothetical protein PR202_gb24698 [Eleusine coracana subsp. coracana]
MPCKMLSIEKATPARASDDSCVVNDVDVFARTIAAIRSTPTSDNNNNNDNTRSLASVLSHYAARWLPDTATPAPSSGRFLLLPPPESPTATWLKKRLLLESLVAALPPPDDDQANYADSDSDGITCDFLLRLLRAGIVAGADAALLGDLEARAARRLDGASLAAVMIPAFGLRHGHGGGVAPTSSTTTLLDVALVLRLVRGFMRDGGGGAAAAARVARLVDAYLAEAALEAGLRPPEFEELARAVPAHARANDDGLYRAVDTYLKVAPDEDDIRDGENLKTSLVVDGERLLARDIDIVPRSISMAHPRASKEERRSLCRLIDARKLSAEAAAHAVQNDRLPVRCVLQVLFLSSEHGNQLSHHHHLSGGGGGGGSFRDLLQARSLASAGARCPSKREAVLAQHHEMRRLREDVARLQVQCHALQAQVDRLMGSEGRRRRGLFRWGAAFLFGGAAAAARVDDSDSGVDRTPLSGGRKVARWRRSHS